MSKEQLDRVMRETEAWLEKHGDDTNVRNGYLGLLSKQELSKEQLDRVMRETEAWLEKHGDDTNVRGAYLGFLSLQHLEKKEALSRVSNIDAWLLGHPQATYVSQRLNTFRRVYDNYRDDRQDSQEGKLDFPVMKKTALGGTIEAQTSSIALPLSDIAGMIEAGIDRVVLQAWKNVPADISEDERFRIAKRNASKIISTLSPKIKRQVAAHFEVRKWEPLKQQDLEA
ncbi:MAG: hypothetical protein HGB06_09705 [Chlorobaculum sp.]|nr:hypothetical protein [Chlorobaculum sp.]